MPSPSKADTLLRQGNANFRVGKPFAFIWPRLSWRQTAGVVQSASLMDLTVNSIR